MERRLPRTDGIREVTIGFRNRMPPNKTADFGSAPIMASMMIEWDSHPTPATIRSAAVHLLLHFLATRECSSFSRRYSVFDDAEKRKFKVISEDCYLFCLVYVSFFSLVRGR